MTRDIMYFVDYGPDNPGGRASVIKFVGVCDRCKMLTWSADGANVLYLNNGNMGWAVTRCEMWGCKEDVRPLPLEDQMAYIAAYKLGGIEAVDEMINEYNYKVRW